MVSILKKGRKKKAEAEPTPAPMAQPPTGPEQAHAPADQETPHHAVVDQPVPDATAAAPAPSAPAQLHAPAAGYTPPDGADDFQLPARYHPAEPAPSREPTRSGSLLSRALLDSGESTAAERDRVAALEFEQAIAPVMDYMRAAVPDATTPEDAERILFENQGEITPDPQGGSFVKGDAFERDARVYYRLLRRDYEKYPRPSERAKKQTSPHLHQVYGRLNGNKGW